MRNDRWLYADLADVPRVRYAKCLNNFDCFKLESNEVMSCYFPGLRIIAAGDTELLDTVVKPWMDNLRRSFQEKLSEKKRVLNAG